jgi:hypothetical protein
MLQIAFTQHLHFAYKSSTNDWKEIYLKGVRRRWAPVTTCGGSGGRRRARTQGWAMRSLDWAQLSVDDGVGSMARSLDRR